MDISSLKSLLMNRPSLVDYLGNSSSASGALSAGQQKTQAQIAQLQNLLDNQSATGDQVILSEEAQALLSQTTESDSSTPVNGVQRGAQSFFMNFLEDVGIDLGKLSDEASSFIQGINQLITDTGATMRDTTTDRMEQEYHKGNRDVYTLLGTNSRLRLAVDYQDDKAAKLTLTDMTGGQVSIAEITVQKTDQGQARLDIARQNREYVNGLLADFQTGAPLSIALYE